jgi:hypothetical protein
MLTLHTGCLWDPLCQTVARMKQVLTALESGLYLKLSNSKTCAVPTGEPFLDLQIVKRELRREL